LLLALVLNVDIEKTEVIFAVFGVLTAVLMDVHIFWNAFAMPIGYRLFGVKNSPERR
jgi:EamA domain-containing membrane protein RarD